MTSREIAPHRTASRTIIEPTLPELQTQLTALQRTGLLVPGQTLSWWYLDDHGGAYQTTVLVYVPAQPDRRRAPWPLPAVIGAWLGGLALTTAAGWLGYAAATGVVTALAKALLVVLGGLVGVAVLVWLAGQLGLCFGEHHCPGCRHH